MNTLDVRSGSMFRPERNRLLHKWVQVVIWGWVTLLVSADLKVSAHPYIHWFVSGVALFLIAPVIVRRRYRIHPWSAMSACLLLLSAAVSSFQSPDPLHDLEQVAKLVMLLLVTPLLFNSIEGVAQIGFRAFVSAVYVNLGFLLIGSAFLPTLARNMAAGRWGTWLNYPGSLWKVGIVVIVHATYCTLASRFRSLDHILLLISSLILIYFDGSRTAILLLTVSIIYLTVIVRVDGRKRTRHLLVGTFVAVALGLAMTWMWPGFRAQPQLNVVGLDRFTSFLQGASRGSDTLLLVDETRVSMVQDALSAIQAHPFLGTGIGTTKSATEVGPMVVHNTYLQVWADLGLLGFIGYIGLVFSWVSVLPRALPKIRAIAKPFDRSVYYNAIFLLIYFAISGLFHPLSTEWSEWITFIVPFALLLDIARSEPLEVSHG